jgi:hypothetical protein
MMFAGADSEEARIKSLLPESSSDWHTEKTRMNLEAARIAGFVSFFAVVAITWCGTMAFAIHRKINE